MIAAGGAQVMTRRRLGDAERYSLRHRDVVRGVGRSEGDRKGIGSGGWNAASSRGVNQRAGNRRRRVELCDGKRCSVSDACRRCPSDYGSSLRDCQCDSLGDGGITGGVGRSKRDRQSISSRGGNIACSRSVDQDARDRRGGVELGRRERRAVGDACRIAPGDDRGRLGDTSCTVFVTLE